VNFVSTYSFVENPSLRIWNSFLKTFPEGNFEQCFEYGEIIRLAFPHSRNVRIIALYNGEPVGIVQGNYSSYLGLGMTLGVVRGPLVNFENEKYLLLVESLLKALENYAIKNRIIQAEILVPEAWQLQGVLRALGYTSTRFMNEYIVNIGNGAGELWKNISHNKRRNIKKATDRGVEVVQSRRHDELLTFYSMLKAARKRGSFSSYPFSYFEAIWRIYKPELSNVFLARWKGKDVAGVFTVIHGKTVYALAAGSLSEGWEVRPNDKMHWEIMTSASQEGYSRYHMGLVSDPPPVKGSDAWGIWRWKREWKGRMKKIQTFEKLFLPKYKLVVKVKQAIDRAYTHTTGIIRV